MPLLLLVEVIGAQCAGRFGCQSLNNKTRAGELSRTTLSLTSLPSSAAHSSTAQSFTQSPSSQRSHQPARFAHPTSNVHREACTVQRQPTRSLSSSLSVSYICVLDQPLSAVAALSACFLCRLAVGVAQPAKCSACVLGCSFVIWPLSRLRLMGLCETALRCQTSPRSSPAPPPLRLRSLRPLPFRP